MKKKYFFAALCALFSSLSTFAQSRIGVSIGPDIAFPTGSFTQSNGFGYGGSATFHFSLIHKRLDLTSSVGYFYFSGKKFNSSFFGASIYNSSSPSINVLPIRLGVNYILNKDKGIFVGFDAGVSIFMINSIQNVVFGTVFDSPALSKNLFSFAPRIGCSIPLKKDGFDISVRYDISPGFTTTQTKVDPITNEQIENPTSITLGYVGLSATYRFSFSTN